VLYGHDHGIGAEREQSRPKRQMSGERELEKTSGAEHATGAHGMVSRDHRNGL